MCTDKIVSRKILHNKFEFSVHKELGRLSYSKDYGMIGTILSSLPSIFVLLICFQLYCKKQKNSILTIPKIYFILLLLTPLFIGFKNHVHEVYADIYSNLKTKVNPFPKYSSGKKIVHSREKKLKMFFDLFVHPNNNLRHYYLKNLPKDFELNFLNVSKYYIIQYIKFYLFK